MMMIAAPQSARLAARFGKRRVVATGMWMVGTGIAIVSTIGVVPSYPVLIGGLCVMAFGMGLAMSPTTDLLMSTVPREKAGMGSAMNDTTRELGGSLGVAVFGSLLASRYAGGLVEALAEVPAAVRPVVEGSLAGALGVSAEAPAGGGALAAAAKAAWVEGFQFSLLVAAIVIGVAGVVAWCYLPDQAHDAPVQRAPGGVPAVPEDASATADLDDAAEPALGEPALR
jgi:MFS family permease